MSREIKFRVWNNNKMDYDSRDLTIRNGILVPVGDGIIMQFTGLKDKNGKDIYEADILDPGNREILWKSNSRIGTVFNCAGWYTRAHKLDLRPECLGCFTFGITQAEDSTIIGNIYENPELIKEA